MINISPQAIWNNLCIPDLTTKSEEIEAFTLDKGENTWREKRKGPQFLIKETGK